MILKKYTASLAILLSFLLTPALSTIGFGNNISVTATVDKTSLSIEDVLRLSIVIQGTQNTPPELRRQEHRHPLGILILNAVFPSPTITGLPR